MSSERPLLCALCFACRSRTAPLGPTRDRQCLTRCWPLQLSSVQRRPGVRSRRARVLTPAAPVFPLLRLLCAGARASPVLRATFPLISASSLGLAPAPCRDSEHDVAKGCSRLLRPESFPARAILQIGHFCTFFDRGGRGTPADRANPSESIQQSACLPSGKWQCEKQPPDCRWLPNYTVERAGIPTGGQALTKGQPVASWPGSRAPGRGG
jgi:hypothetical protein